MPVTDPAAPRWLAPARRVYRFMEHPFGNLSPKAKFCLKVYTVLLVAVLWAVR